MDHHGPHISNTIAGRTWTNCKCIPRHPMPTTSNLKLQTLKGANPLEAICNYYSAACDRHLAANLVALSYSQGFRRNKSRKRSSHLQSWRKSFTASQIKSRGKLGLVWSQSLPTHRPGRWSWSTSKRRDVTMSPQLASQELKAPLANWVTCMLDGKSWPSVQPWLAMSYQCFRVRIKSDPCRLPWRHPPWRGCPEKDNMIISIMENWKTKSVGKLCMTGSRVLLHYTVLLEFIEEYRSTNPNQQSHEPQIIETPPLRRGHDATSQASQVCTR